MTRQAVWAEVDLGAIKDNVQHIRSTLRKGVRFCAVVKADAYGHGAVPVAKAVLAAGADQLAVAMLQEAVVFRLVGIEVRILILGYTPPEEAAQVVAQKVTAAVYSLETAEALSHAAQQLGCKAIVHLKVDTGMGRIGVQPEEAGVFAAQVAALPGIEVEGVFSHFATADCEDKSYAHEQFRRFQEALQNIEAHGVKVAVRHIANSAATLELPEYHLDMVRPGIILYGIWPSEEVKRSLPLRPAMSWKACVSHVKCVPPGSPVSYGCIYKAGQETCIATLPVGYADGWTRLLAGKAAVSLAGQRAPVVGRICMDQCMVALPAGAKVAVGEPALLFGPAGPTVEEVAAWLGTIPYEIVCMVGKRVPRRYGNA